MTEYDWRAILAALEEHVNSLKIQPLVSEAQINEKIREIGAQITDKFAGKELTVLCILKGSFLFFADLIREIKTDINCEFIGASSYGSGSTSSGQVKLTLDSNLNLEGRNVLIVEDIVDTGLTMNYLEGMLDLRKPKSISKAALLMKPDALKTECKLDYVGFEIPNDFVVGYGLDYQGLYRNLPYIGQVSSLN